MRIEGLRQQYVAQLHGRKFVYMYEFSKLYLFIKLYNFNQEIYLSFFKIEN